MERAEMIKWALKGLEAEWQKHEKTVREGYSILKDIREGNHKGKVTERKVLEVISNNQQQIEELYNKHQKLKWELALMEEGN